MPQSMGSRLVSYRIVALLTCSLARKTICLFNECVDRTLNIKEVYIQRDQFPPLYFYVTATINNMKISFKGV